MESSIAYRISTWDTPLRVNPNRSAGRYNDAGSPATQYLCRHPLGPWAEYLRANDLRNEEDLAVHRLRIWVLRVDLSDAFRIDFNHAADFGLDPKDLIDDDHTACRRLARRLREDPDSPETLIVPSAALPGTENIVILGERVQIPYSWNPIDDVDVPACVIAERSQPPQKSPSLVRYQGDSHSQLEAWQAGQEYRFADFLQK
jgi:RES domain-containing protein